ncbi:MAG: hypothetical protein ABH823_04035 [bacterium]
MTATTFAARIVQAGNSGLPVLVALGYAGIKVVSSATPNLVTQLETAVAQRGATLDLSDEMLAARLLERTGEHLARDFLVNKRHHDETEIDEPTSLAAILAQRTQILEQNQEYFHLRQSDHIAGNSRLRKSADIDRIDIGEIIAFYNACYTQAAGAVRHLSGFKTKITKTHKTARRRILTFRAITNEEKKTVTFELLLSNRRPAIIEKTIRLNELTDDDLSPRIDRQVTLNNGTELTLPDFVAEEDIGELVALYNYRIFSVPPRGFFEDYIAIAGLTAITTVSGKSIRIIIDASYETQIATLKLFYADNKTPVTEKVFAFQSGNA